MVDSLNDRIKLPSYSLLRYNIHTLDQYRYNVLHFYLMLVRKYADTIGYLYETWNGYTCEELANIKLQKSNPYGEQWVATKIESGDRGSDHLIVRKNRQTYMPLYEIIPLSSYPSEIQDLCR